MNKVLAEDFALIHQTLGERLNALKGKSVIITGANGMLASYMMRFLSWLNGTHQFNLSLTGLVREVRTKIPGVTYVTGDVNTVNLTQKYDYIIHSASLASPVHYGSNPIGVSLPNVMGTINLLGHAEKFSPESFLFVSSSEVYGDFGMDKAAIGENEFGKLDPMNPRSCYAESKRMGENLCVSWFKQKNIPVKIIRPFHTYGPGLTRTDGRVYADFIYSIVDSKNITLNSKGEARRAFCYQSDALMGMLLVLLEGKNGEAYNLGNPDQELSIREAADTAATVFPERGVKVIINEQVSQGYLKSPVLRNSPSIKKIGELGWKPSVSLKDGMMKTVRYIEGEV